MLAGTDHATKQPTQKLMGSKLRHDATVDISILLASLVLVNTPLVTLPLRLVTSPLLVLPGQRWNAWRGRAMQVRRKGCC